MSRTSLLPALAGLAFALLLAPSARAEMELSLYTGFQTAPHSRVEGDDPGGAGDFDFLAGWEGNSFEMPPYYGVRATWWRTDNLGFGVEINHAKVYADDESRRENGFNRLEFTDGLNYVTANVMYRWPGEWGVGVTPYVGAGLGLAIPHVDVETAGGKVYEYQVTGPAAVVMAGASYALTERWSLFGEYKGGVSQNTVDLGSGGTLETRIITNAINVGVAFNF